MFLPGIAAMLLMPLVLYFLSPLEIKSTPNASTFAFMGWSFGRICFCYGTWGNFYYDIFKPCFFYIHTISLLLLQLIYQQCFLFFIVQLALGAPPLFYAFIMITSGNVMMALTHYATGTAPVIFGIGCVTLKKWWSIGFVISIVDIVVMIAVGLIWWKILGFY